MAKPNPNAIFIFGLQKSGTSAITALLSKKTGMSATIDTHYFWEPYLGKIISGEIDLAKHIEKHAAPFSKDIVKEPNSTFFIPKLRQVFELEKYVFIVRNPFDNIRSILNRLEIPGDGKNLNVEKLPLVWRHLFEKNEGNDYVSVLAECWVEANGQDEIIDNPACALVRYEDFLLDKENSIEKLALELGLIPKKPIGHLVDVQYQPKGNRKIEPLVFFGEDNYEKIRDICGTLMKKFGY